MDIEETDLNEEEEGIESETPDDGGQSSKEEESVDELKARLKKAEEDRDNYKAGMLSHKAKSRTLDGEILPEKKSDISPEVPDVSEEKVLSILHKQNEKSTMREVINPSSSLYLPELVDDKQFQEIVTEYLPRNIDKSSKEGIHKALRIAVAAWKADKGIVTKADTKSAQANLSGTSTDTPSSGTLEAKEKVKILRQKPIPPSEWYKK